MERKEARRAVLQARQQGLEAAREAAFAASRRSDVTAELEAALLPGSPHASKGPGGKSPSDSGCLPGEDGSSRDARSLWQRVRRGLGLTVRWEDDRPYVERVSLGGAMQPTPSWNRLYPAQTVIDWIVGLFNSTGLGTGLSLRSDSMLIRRDPTPGVFSPAGDLRAFHNTLTSSWLNLLLLCLPFGLYLGWVNANQPAVFALNFLALIPLALFLGEVTEDLAVRFGDVIGGLLNATFGNVVELLLALSALRRGLYGVVAASLLGSILSNLLLVLGCAFFCGGLKYKEQRFSAMANKVSSSLLFLACIGIIIPSTGRIIYGRHVVTRKVLLNVSHAVAVVMLLIYVGYLLFQLKTHADCFEEGGGGGEGEEEEGEGAALSLVGAFGALTLITVVVAICSELLTGAIDEVATSLNVNEAFLGLIVLPIAGNVTEHLTAVFVAVKNKMDLSISIALGSSIQVALCILPVTVLAGWAMGRPFTLDFDAFAVVMMAVSVVLAYVVCSDGASNWLLGLQLIATYVLICFMFALKKEPSPLPPTPPPPSPPSPLPHAW